MELKIHQLYTLSLESIVQVYLDLMEAELKCLGRVWRLQVGLMHKIHSWVHQELKDSDNLVIQHRWHSKDLVMKVPLIRFTFSNLIKEFLPFTMLRLIKRPAN